MALPEPHLPTRRQILDDQTGEEHRLCARSYVSADGDSLVPEDAWVKNFVDRLAALVRNISGKD
jgi:hypothetical protein